ncbi:hypothetical protein FJT64_022458 [Amphibalanus amphitrite]|uniref:Endonuclease/exonuclease/phosphatase domain-containing protein n=1 Tax=Amphibalanus amphitrite TaxID=1232801 RepID=A0A6A4WIT5_AMPAM|nr:hypothetical protein FJT64_022458 [Amphibalanus amphitrite]
MVATSSCALKIGHLNVRSLTAHLDEVNLLLLREELDVLCLSETWLTDSVDSSMLLFPGYTIRRRDREGRTGGGVALICRNTLKLDVMRVPSAGSTLEAAPDLTSNARVIPCNISDHDLITASITNTKTRHVPVTCTVRSTRRVDTAALCLDLLLADWAEVDRADSITDKWNGFLRVWDPVINQHMPMKTVKMKHRHRPWMDDDAVT